MAEAALDRWEIGCAPPGWQGLWDHLRGKGVAEELILGAGLAKPSNSGKQPYDTFRNRIMFPIRDIKGRVVAFGGRAMDPNQPAKYLNSPESRLFSKSRVLYGLYQGMAAIREHRSCFLVEGYMDVIGLARVGVANVCAPLGTALTAEHLKLVARYAAKVTCIFDGDRAGRGAAVKFCRLSIEQSSLESGVVLMPPGKDP